VAELRREWGVLRRRGDLILWVTLYETEEVARNNATPQDSVEYREVTKWSGDR